MVREKKHKFRYQHQSIFEMGTDQPYWRRCRWRWRPLLQWEHSFDVVLPRCRFLSQILLKGLYGERMNVMLCVFGAYTNCGRVQHGRATIRNMRINVELSHWMCVCVWLVRACAHGCVDRGGGVECLLSISGKIFIDMCSLENKASTAKNSHRITHRQTNKHKIAS